MTKENRYKPKSFKWLTQKPKRLTLKKKLKANFQFDKKLAQMYHDTAYYEAMQEDIKDMDHLADERKRLSTRHKKRVTNLIAYYKTLLETKSKGVFHALKGIYKKNQELAREAAGRIGTANSNKHSNLLYLTSSVPMLVVAYRKIRKNKGAGSLAHTLSDGRYERLNGIQISLINRTYRAPDRLSKRIFLEVSKLLRKGQYPWGASKRIYVAKPGKKDAQRPITIPPFMDRVIQQAITMVLQAIYEPWFHKLNVSFGFRPRLGVHDAIFNLTTLQSKGCFHALEGDIKAAYDKVNKDKLIELLGRKIEDRKFLNLIKQRLDYQYFDTKTQKYYEDKEGIPQGGIDSPYLWNIYMHHFDLLAMDTAQKLMDEHNLKFAGTTLGDKASKRADNPQKRAIKKYSDGLRNVIKLSNIAPDLTTLREIFKSANLRKGIGPYPFDIKRKRLTFHKEVLGVRDWYVQGLPKETKTWLNPDKKDSKITPLDWSKDQKATRHLAIKYVRRLKHKYRAVTSRDPKRPFLKFTYVRYADDWILITNAPLWLLKELKEDLKNILKSELYATLSEEKTLITDMRKSPAHFLGFEIRTYRKFKISTYERYGKEIVAETAGKEVFALPDRQRLINRMYMKGYCTKKGYPREVGWLSCLEPYIIIERYNAVLRGLANYYTEFIRTPRRQLARWFYILKYSCLKTLAQKYNTTIRNIFKKFPYKPARGEKSKERTIEIKVIQKIKGKEYTKTWKLLTNNELIEAAKKIRRFQDVQERFAEWRKGKTPTFDGNTKNQYPAIVDDSFLNRIIWVNLRTQASLDFACSICGSEKDVEMHHIRSIRKQAYREIPSELTWKQQMSLRNRKQIPVCIICHELIHQGRLEGGTKIGSYAPQFTYDTRLITIESHIHPGSEKRYIKSLEEKGWIESKQEE